MSRRAESFFLPAADGERYCIHHPPQGALRGSIFYLHPFAEEMNKSRRMAALAARAFAAQGWAVLQLDLQGCGDSSGEFGDASWQAWLDDAALGMQWLSARYGRVDVLWGLRLGALLACSIASQCEAAPDLLLWQPVLSGQQHLSQFLRLKTVAEMLDADPDKAGTRGGTKALREQLRRGEPIEVAGYKLAPSLALPLDQARLQLPAGYSGRVHWLEVSSAENPALMPVSAQFVDARVTEGIAINAGCVSGPAFWQSVEIAEAPILIEASIAALSAASISANPVNV